MAKLDKMLSGRTGKTLTLALKSLLAKTPLNKTKKRTINIHTKVSSNKDVHFLPNEIFAVTAKRGLLEKSSHKFMIFNLVDILLS